MSERTKPKHDLSIEVEQGEFEWVDATYTPHPAEEPDQVKRWVQSRYVVVTYSDASQTMPERRYFHSFDELTDFLGETLPELEGEPEIEPDE